MVLDPNNPLSAIGLGNDPTLSKRTTDSAAASDALRRNLGQLTLQGQNADRLAGINNESLENRTLAPLGLSNRGTGAKTLQTDLARIATNNSNLSIADAFNKNASGMGTLAYDVGYTPTHQATAQETVSPKNKLMASIPNRILAAQQQGSAAAETQATQSAKTTDKSFVLPGGVKPAGTMRTTESGQELKGKVKDKDKNQAQGIIDDVKKQFFMRKISGIPALSKLGIIDFRKDVDDNGKPVIVGIDAEGIEYDLNNLR